MAKKTAPNRPRGSSQIRKEKRATGEFWGYDVWIRQPNYTRKRYREFCFYTKAEAQQALAALKTAGWKSRYGLKPPPTVHQTTVIVAITSYIKVARANLAANKSDDNNHCRNSGGHLKTLQRWAEFAGVDRPVSTIQYDDFVFWVAAEMARGMSNRQSLKKATIRRGLNIIRAALNHAIVTRADLKNYKVPKSPLTKKAEEERDRVLTDEEILQISAVLVSEKGSADALFFFRIALITGGRMAELLRMKWEESSERFGTVKLYSSKTQKWRTIKAPAAAALIATRRIHKHSMGVVIDRPDDWIRSVLRKASKKAGILYGQQVPGGWTPHDLRHTCLTNLALAGVPLNGIKEYAGHASIVETQRYLKFMPESIELAAMATNRLAELTSADSSFPPEATSLNDAGTDTASPGDNPGTKRRKA